MKGTPKMATFGVNNNLAGPKSQETSADKENVYSYEKMGEAIIAGMDALSDFKNGRTGGERINGVAKSVMKAILSAK